MANSLRLTLRTLLSYLDDTLDPAQAKLIGQKVAESDQARELMDRIKQVTRRRRLTAPPAAGPGGIDANTIAEYLDNEVTPEQAAEVEQICLASDVHLAEVVACHQILTLVLGEPALVPPSSRQRMYGLVKGPEAIPFRKPPRREKNADLDLSTSDVGHDTDEATAGSGSFRNTFLLVGGILVAVCALFFVFWQVFWIPGDRDRKDAHAKNEKKDGDQKKGAEDKKDADDKKGADDKKSEDKKGADDKKAGDDKKGGDDKKSSEDKKGGDDKKGDDKKGGEDKTPQIGEEIPFTPPDPKVMVVGQYQPNFKEADALLQKVGDRYERFTVKGLDVSSGRTLLALPAMRSKIQLRKGIDLELWGSSPELWPSPFIYESMVDLHTHPVFDLDMTMKRGRILITNNKPLGKPALIRLRFENPQQKSGSGYFDITLQGSGSALAVERLCGFPPDEPFYEDPAHPNRQGPYALMICFFLDGQGDIRSADTYFVVDARKDTQMVEWTSMGSGLKAAQPIMPDWLLPSPKMGNPTDRKDMKSAALNLAGNIRSKDLPVALPEALDAPPTPRRLAIRCYGAIDDVNKLLELLDSESAKPDVRRAALSTIVHWKAQQRDAEYQIFKLLQAQQTNVVARKIMELMHGLPPEDLGKPATWQKLIDDLNNPVIALRELSAWQLESLVPAAAKRINENDKTRYSASAPEAQRMQSMAAWRNFIPPGSLPKKQ